MLPEPLLVVRKLASVFDVLQVDYLVGGSIASSLHGSYRSTQDVDFVADISMGKIGAFVAALQEEFYVDAEMIEEAIRTNSSFSVIHLPTMVKADVFLKKPTVWADWEWQRRTIERIGSDDSAFAIYVASPEDMVLQKLYWFQLGGRVSERQWNDVQGILKVQSATLDLSYLIRGASELNLMTLLTEALKEADIPMRDAE